MKIQNSFITQILLLAFLLGAGFTTAKAQLLQLFENHRAVANSAIGSGDDIGNWASPDSYNTNHLGDGDFSQTYTIDFTGSVYFSVHTSSSQLSTLTATDDSLHVAGRFGVTSAIEATPNGSALWNTFSYLTCTFEIYQPMIFTISATNNHTSDAGADGHDSFVGLQDGLGADLAVFGESTTWGYGGLTNPVSGTVSGILTPGFYTVRAISGELAQAVGVFTHSADRLTTFTFNVTPIPTLNIQPTNNAVIISWPAAATGFVLKSAAVLTAPTWETVTNVPVPVADMLQVILPATTGDRFFRLEK